MDIALQDIERQADEQLLLEAEVLLDKNAVGQLQEIERNFWITWVHLGDRNLEIELKISAGKIRQVSCECSDFLQTGFCAHILAAALELRKKLTQVVQPPRSVPPKVQSEKLTTALILEEIEPQALYDFIRTYAKKNRKFELALTTHFASSITSIDSNEKYLNLIEATIKTALKPDRSLGVRGTIILEKLFRELLQQAQKTLVTKDFQETWRIIQSLILKSAPLLSKAGDRQEDLFAPVLEAFGLMHDLLRQDVAPALKSDIWDFCTEEVTKIVYRKHSLDIGLFQVLQLLCDEQEKQSTLITLMLKQLQVYENEGLAIHSLVFQYLQVADPALHAPLLRHYYEQLADILMALELALLANLPDVGKILLDFAQKQQMDAANTKKTEALHLQLAHRLSDTRLEIELLREQLVRYFDPEHYRKIKKLDPQGLYWQPEATLELLRASAHTPTQQDCVAGILGEEQQQEQLIDWIRQHASIELLLNHDHYLLPVHHTAVLELYDNLLSSFLDTHIGPVPAQKIGRIIRHLKALNADALVAYLVEQFRKKYPNRHTLMEELSLYDGYED
ncbi:MAG: SWIM zinc finger domain-containing protein [Saprospiraceae bacterium]|nr:SWIM zinc finger domain-containing protein [Saprospiraceae bacterium]